MASGEIWADEAEWEKQVDEGVECVFLVEFLSWLHEEIIKRRQWFCEVQDRVNFVNTLKAKGLGLSAVDV